ncbi:MAG: hypothetical protein Q4C96_00190 [Planctomycetia bacterium]|nr:hypothetical protein [Planctomycetia bacterium]
MNQEDFTRIKKIRAQALANLEDITITPKPSYSLDGQSVSWETYLKQLRETVSWCDSQLMASNNCELRTHART